MTECLLTYISYISFVVFFFFFRMLLFHRTNSSIMSHLSKEQLEPTKPDLFHTCELVGIYRSGFELGANFSRNQILLQHFCNHSIFETHGADLTKLRQGCEFATRMAFCCKRRIIKVLALNGSVTGGNLRPLNI